MNKKQSTIDEIMHAVIECCNIGEDYDVVYRNVRGKDRHDNVLMTRCIFVTQMMFMGYSRTTTAAYLGRSVKSIGNILAQAHRYRIGSRAYVIAEAESTLKVKDIEIR